MRLHLLDFEKVSALIEHGKLKGTTGAVAARLSGPSVEITKFLASNAGWNSIHNALRIRRMRPEE